MPEWVPDKDAPACMRYATYCVCSVPALRVLMHARSDGPDPLFFVFVFSSGARRSSPSSFGGTTAEGAAMSFATIAQKAPGNTETAEVAETGIRPEIQVSHHRVRSVILRINLIVQHRRLPRRTMRARLTARRNRYKGSMQRWAMLSTRVGYRTAAAAHRKQEKACLCAPT